MSFKPAQHLVNVQGGQQYLPVAWRLVWLRGEQTAEAPDAQIDTELVRFDDHVIVMKATITLTNGARATAHAMCLRDALGNAVWKQRQVEKVETSAVGRALAMLGYGTQFDIEIAEEGEYLADAPQPAAGKPSNGVGTVHPVFTLTREDGQEFTFPTVDESKPDLRAQPFLDWCQQTLALSQEEIQLRLGGTVSEWFVRVGLTSHPHKFKVLSKVLFLNVKHEQPIPGAPSQLARTAAGG